MILIEILVQVSKCHQKLFPCRETGSSTKIPIPVPIEVRYLFCNVYIKNQIIFRLLSYLFTWHGITSHSNINYRLKVCAISL